MGTNSRMGGARYVFAGTSDQRDEVGTKTCPRCGEVLFSDMDVCYGCLYDFTKDRSQEVTPEDEALRSLVKAHVPNTAGTGERQGISLPNLDDPLAGIELDEVDDEPLSDIQAEPAAAPSLPPRHSKREVPSADDTLDLAVLDATTLAVTPSQPFAIVASSEDMQVWLPLPEWGLTVGRDEANDIVLRSRSVSRRHLRLVPQGNAVLVEDCGATNPATVGGRTITHIESVDAGETVKVCGVTLAIKRYEEVVGKDPSRRGPSLTALA